MDILNAGINKLATSLKGHQQLTRQSRIWTVFLVTTTFSFIGQTIAQETNVQPQTIIAIRQLDSLYRQLDWINRDYIDINYEKKKIKFNEQDSTTFNFTDTLLLRQYCKRTKKDFLIFHSILQLLIDNGFLHLGRAGPGDCNDCSNEIVYKITKQAVFAYILKDLKSRCMPDNCYWDVVYNKRTKKDLKVNAIKITDDILLVKRPIEN